MKRLISTIFVCVLLLQCGATASAQVEGTGFTAGFTSSVASATSNFTPASINAYHAGVTHKFNLGLGFAYQMGAMYQVKGTELDLAGFGSQDVIKAMNATVSYVEMPFQLQWGPDLVAFRPYALVEPFVGYGVSLKLNQFVPNEAMQKAWKGTNISRWEYGVGIGGGLEFWKIQISGKYFWNFGSLVNGDGMIDPSAISETVKSAFEDKRGFNGFSVSLTYFFKTLR